MSPESLAHALTHGPAALTRELHLHPDDDVDRFADPADAWDHAYDAHRDAAVGL